MILNVSLACRCYKYFLVGCGMYCAYITVVREVGDRGAVAANGRYDLKGFVDWRRLQNSY